MDNIIFDDNQYEQNQDLYTSSNKKGMVGFLIKRGIAKDAKAANLILTSVAILFFGITIFLIKKEDVIELTPEQIEESQAYFNSLEQNSQSNK